jgi:hypothetical protein
MIVISPMTPRRALPWLFPVLVLMTAACSSGSAASPSGSPSGSAFLASSAPSPSIALPITTPDQAASLVIASDLRFEGLRPQDPNQIGGCCFYQATDRSDGTFDVGIEMGWGDCPAGCINRHHWSYNVTAHGNIALQREDGPPVPPGLTAGGTGGLPAGPGIAGQALAGPTCPVVKPGDPACNARPVVGATILIRDAGGTVVAQMTTDEQGRFQVTLPSGPYRIEPQAVEGLMGTAQQMTVNVGGAFEVVTISYDTGIR